MSAADQMQAQGFVQVGRSTPGGPGDIHVSETLIAQKGRDYVRRMVRGTYAAAYDKIADAMLKAREVKS